MIIYKVTNRVNGKIYIGQTIKSLHKRRLQHLNNARKGVKTHFYDAIRKYGESNFDFEVLCSANSKEVLNELETYYINKFDSIKNGYNMVDGGNNNVMFIPDVKEKHANRLKDPSVREKISKGMKRYRENNPFTDEHRANLSRAMKGNHNFGTGDTRSIGCYCIDEYGTEHHFHSYLDAGKWWYNNYKPFPYSACTYQRKIKQSIQFGFSTYGRGATQQIFYIPEWYKEKGDD